MHWWFQVAVEKGMTWEQIKKVEDLYDEVKAFAQKFSKSLKDVETKIKTLVNTARNGPYKDYILGEQALLCCHECI